ncbi:thiamine biosynthesis protein ApbE [Flavobacterium branchiophilum NBRC 15030 = ATCC 35035]|uniref:FAD:protein FMN transferase n=1 Tax=Flavobacterium branchiophilum TaxID=55197 RepID=A0A543FZI0_9FLAO|nr:FAD:protein FMN transferase [Flavobacterium branchiophilum]OXA76743.1 thiamine biosynthesis protein ApbE [Flavobacterium branchiophilum NBRC 15030 = ATCC 35035]TQM39241.1 thiamine biosynthesis lipoprotein [Flavobacterium branchiophilum]GEM54123.1 FAD:protein FMN transferase [Flavobacterium branchiophilum NBRC 15030 = ATCC 35035]
MKKIIVFLILTITFNSFSQIIVRRKLTMLTSPFEMTVVAKDSLEGHQYIDEAIAEVRRIELLISDWIPTTQISLVNQNAGIQPIKVDEEVFELVKRAIKVSKLTDGAFDISYASMDKIWKYDGSMTALPSDEAIKKSVAKIGYQKIILNETEKTIFLKDKGMKLGLGGIGQGFIADKIKQLLRKKGCLSGIANVSGDIAAWGKQPNGEPWTVGIINPMNKNKVFATFPLVDASVETSGTYEKYVVFNGKRYSHIINPKTGWPAQGIVSVTVFAKDTEIADGLAKGVFLFGVEAGIDLINQLKGVECIVVDDLGKIHTSKGINIEKMSLNYK